jgi:hypothetical protein
VPWLALISATLRRCVTGRHAFPARLYGRDPDNMLRGRLAADSVMHISAFANATDRFPSRLRFVPARTFFGRAT